MFIIVFCPDDDCSTTVETVGIIIYNSSTVTTAFLVSMNVLMVIVGTDSLYYDNDYNFYVGKSNF